METDKFYAVFNDLTFEEYIDMESAVNAYPYIIILRRFYDKIKSHFNENYFYHYEWITFSDKGLFINIIERKWKIISIIDQLQRGYYISFEIADPKGLIEKHTINNGGIPTLIDGIKFLRDVNKFDSWSHYNLSKENEILKKENTDLKEEIRKLKSL